jgi:hypothetical protein
VSQTAASSLFAAAEFLDLSPTIAPNRPLAASCVARPFAALILTDSAVDAADQNQHAQNGSCHGPLSRLGTVSYIWNTILPLSSSTPVTRLEPCKLVVGRRRRHSGLIPTVLSSISASGKQRLPYRLRSPPLLQLHRLARLRGQVGWLRTSTDTPEFMGSHQVSINPVGALEEHNGKVDQSSNHHRGARTNLLRQ